MKYGISTRRQRRCASSSNLINVMIVMATALNLIGMVNAATPVTALAFPHSRMGGTANSPRGPPIHFHHERDTSLSSPPSSTILQSHNPIHDPNTENTNSDEVNRRSFLSRTALSLTSGIATSTAIASGGNGVTARAFAPFESLGVMGRDVVSVGFPSLSSETCLLGLLPVSNAAFRRLQKDIEQVSFLRISATDETAWRIAEKASLASLKFLDANRRRLEPVFNEDDPTLIYLTKAERGERLIGDLRDQISEMSSAALARDAHRTLTAQKTALGILAVVGESLVSKYPFDVPSEGKYSYLPRLLGRARVTFVLSRKNKVLGNVTMVADGYAAPITAGNFVDLSVRGFYTGLPVKFFKKRLSQLNFPTETSVVTNTIKALPKLVRELEREVETEVRERRRGPKSLSAGGAASGMEGEEDDAYTLTVPVMGSYQEGFYDPLTAKPRRIPLELAKIDGASTAKMTYPTDDLSPSSSRLILTFDTPNLVAMNHPDKFPNGGSSEFFVIPDARALSDEKVSLLDGQYAPFGYVVTGMELMQSLLPGDVISATIVDDVGVANLKKLRETSFADVMQSTNLEE